jgi:peptidoglycan/LPS O-acetylase OafA/YrhL
MPLEQLVLPASSDVQQAAPEYAATAAGPALHPQAGPPEQPAPMWLKGGNIPALDGLRALSIGLVLLAHASLTWHGASGSSGSLVRLGGIGVDLFFVISGFLITLLLLRERRRTGTISLRAFYVRRAWRILPAYLLFLASLLALSMAGLVKLTERDWAGALTYTVNFLPAASWPVGHLWSLSVEEHFYLVWPLLLIALGPGWAGGLAAGYVVIAPFVRLVISAADLANLDIDYCTPARIDTIAVGCLLAFVAEHRGAQRFMTRLGHRGAALMFVVLLAGLVVSNTILIGSGTYAITIRRTVDALCFAGLVCAGISHTDGLLARLLNATPLVWIGRLSYGLYLWQQPLLNPHGEHWACQWPVNVALAVGFAVVSFALVERPALRLREQQGWGRV